MVESYKARETVRWVTGSLIYKRNIMYVGQKILGWVMSCMGTFAIIGSIDPLDGYGLLGGIMFLASGVTILMLVKKLEK